MRSVGQVFTIFLSGAGFLSLRPSLRCAFLLAERPGGFQKLFKDLQDGAISAICATLRAAGVDLPHLEAKALSGGLSSINTTSTILLGFVLSAAGLDVDPEAEAAAPKPAKAAPRGTITSYTEFLEGLYQKATGWLGLPPETALDATPGEIIHAIRGRTQLLRQLFGASEDTTAKTAPELAEKAKTIFGAMGTVKPDQQRREA